MRLRVCLLFVICWFPCCPLLNLAQTDTPAPVNLYQKGECVRQWIIMGPFPNIPLEKPLADGSLREGFGKDYLEELGGEKKAVINLKTQITFIDENGIHQTVKAGLVQTDSSGIVNLKKHFTENEFKVAYAFSYIQSPADQMLTCFFGSSDGAKIWINGELVYSKWQDRRGLLPRQDSFNLPLKQGLNSVLVKVEQEKWDWGFVFELIESPPPLAEFIPLRNNYFELLISPRDGGVHKLVRVHDIRETNYLLGVLNEGLKFTGKNKEWFGHLTTTFRTGTGPWKNLSTGQLDSIRQLVTGADSVQIIYNSSVKSSQNPQPFNLIEKWSLVDQSLHWDIRFKNISDAEIQFGDLGVHLPFNQYWSGGNQQDIHENRVMRHMCIALNGSYLYWQRPSGEGPFLVMMTGEDTKLEYYQRRLQGQPFGMAEPAAFEGLVTVYLYSLLANPGNWFYPPTSLTLNQGEEKTLQFRFRWANDYQELKTILYEEGLIDADSRPGMVIPADLYALLDLHTKKKIETIVPEFPDQTQIEYLGQPQTDHYIYKISFTKRGSNKILLNYGKDEQMGLLYYVTDPLETAIKKHAAFRAARQQELDSSKAVFGVFNMWDANKHYRVTTETDPELPCFFLNGTDDIGFGGPLALSEKNVYFPVQDEIDALERWAKYYLWEGDGEQRADTYELYWCWQPWPNKTGTGRSYNYPHVANTYHNLYRIGKMYGLTRYLKPEEYLYRAYRTLKTMFTFPMWSDGGKKWGLMGESGTPKLIASLRKEGMLTEADEIEKYWQAKIDYFDSTAYPFGSEITYDATAYEAAHALGVYGTRLDLIEKTYHANRMTRSHQPVWFQYGSDNRWMGDSHYRLSYMSQLAGWALLDYALNYAENPTEIMPIAYGSYLSSYANYVSEGPSAGASRWVFYPDSGITGWAAHDGEIGIGIYGALITAASVIDTDPVFGLIGYGCEVKDEGKYYAIFPKDGIRQRVYSINLKIQLTLGRDAFASQPEAVKVWKSQDRIEFFIENMFPESPHPLTITVSGLEKGFYQVNLNDQRAMVFENKDQKDNSVSINLGKKPVYQIKIIKHN